MKQHTSVFWLCARRSLPGLALLLLLMAAVESVLFGLLLRANPNAYPEWLYEKAHLGLVCGGAFVLLCGLLALPRTELNGKQGYTIRRLSLPRWEVWLWQSLSNALCFLILWGAQLGIALALFALYEGSAERVSGQSILLTFYRSDFLHSLLPLRETSRYIRNIFLVLALGAATAAAPMRMYVGKKGSLVLLIALMAVVLGFFSRGISDFGGDLFLCMGAAVAIIGEVLAILDVMGEGENDEV